MVSRNSETRFWTSVVNCNEMKERAESRSDLEMLSDGIDETTKVNLHIGEVLLSLYCLLASLIVR